MKKIMHTLFRWEPQKDLLPGLFCGTAVVLLSILMIYTKSNVVINIVVRDLLMILVCGIAIPLYFIGKKGEFAQYGLHFRRWYIYLPLNFVLGLLLLLLFLKEVPLAPDFTLTSAKFFSITYIMLAGIFETIVFYSFIRTTLERSFGAVPAIIMAAVFYSFHHAGFQPEFAKLIFVGLMYALVFRLGNSALLIFPFFWGVGACYDVLVQSTVVAEIQYPAIRSLVLLAGMFSVCLFLFYNKTTGSKENL